MAVNKIFYSMGLFVFLTGAMATASGRNLCDREIFVGAKASLPTSGTAQWIELLRSIQIPASEGKGLWTTHPIRTELRMGAELLVDSRLYKLQEFIGLPKEVYERDYKVWFESWQSEYEFLGEKSIWMGDRIYFFRRRANGHLFTALELPGGTTRNSIVSGLKEKILQALRIQEQYSLSNTTSSLFDHFIDREQRWTRNPNLKNLLWKYSNRPRQRETQQTSLGVVTRDELARFYLGWPSHYRYPKAGVLQSVHFSWSDLHTEVLDTHAEDPLWHATSPRAEEGAEQRGRMQQKAWIDETISLPFHDYMLRKHWPEQIVIDRFYTNALAAKDETVMIRILRGKKIVGVLAFNRAPYGAVRFKNRATGKVELKYGPFGSAFDQQFGDHRSPKVDISLWNDNVPITKMENFLNIILPRPYVIESFLPPDSIYQHSMFYRQLQENPIPGVDPDPTEYVWFGAGEIWEPTFYWLDKNMTEHDEAYNQIVAESLSLLLAEHRGVLFLTSGQKLYTYNPARLGRALYGPEGFTDLDDYASTSVEGVQWQPFSADVARFANQFGSKSRVAPQGLGATQNLVSSIKASFMLQYEPSKNR